MPTPIARSVATIRLPACSGVRTRKVFLKLLERVDPDAKNGFGFEGSLFRPGALVTLAELRPTPDYPETPVILEYSMAPARVVGARRVSGSLYVLWRWQAEAHEWRELGRSVSDAWEWALDLRPLAIRALAPAKADETPLDLPLIAREITGYLDGQLNILTPADRIRVLGIVHDQLASRLCA